MKDSTCWFGDIQTDITKTTAIEEMYKKIGKFDALIAATGQIQFGRLCEFNHEKYLIGLQSKLMKQINLVLLGLQHIDAAGSFTLTSGTYRSHLKVQISNLKC